MNEGAAKAALRHITSAPSGRGKTAAIRYAARRFRITVGEIHQAAHCANGANCTGAGCKIGK
jgi:hypothetical protein